MSRLLRVAAFVGLLALAVSSLVACGSGNGVQRLSATMPNAIGLAVGSPVLLRGIEIGKIASMEARSDKAFITMNIENPTEPLRVGTTIGVKWASVLGHRMVELTQGPAQAPALQNGAVIEAGSHQVLVEEVLEGFDAPTRVHLQGMLKQLDGTFQQNQPDLNRTLKDAGPTVQALGAVLNGVGADGQSIKTLLANLNKITGVLAERKAKLSSTVLDLNRMTSASAVHQQALTDGLRELPGTLDAARVTLDKVPAATDATVPLLDDLRPAAARLPGVATKLRDVMTDLTPALEDLPPVLKDTDRVLDIAPKFFDKANSALDQLGDTVKPKSAGDAVRFLRPYTPELIGWLGNWASVWSGYDSGGHFANVTVTTGPFAANHVPDIQFPGYWPDRFVPPGLNSGQPWADANAWADGPGKGQK